MIHYEYPFNERVRTLLRLEDLFERFGFFFAQDDALQHHVSLTTLFEIADVASRADLRTDLLKELDRQRQVLALLRNNPQINHQALEAVLYELEAAHVGVAQMQGKTGQHLTDNEWLSSIRSRAIIPGGTCEFDLPSYAAWQRGTKEARQRDLHMWIAPFLPLRDATALVLRLLRESGHSSKVLASGGSFQQMLSGKTYQLMQVAVDDLRVIPETSANKYMMWVRFTQQDGVGKPRPLEADVPFVLTLCMV